MFTLLRRSLSSKLRPHSGQMTKGFRESLKGSAFWRNHRSPRGLPESDLPQVGSELVVDHLEFEGLGHYEFKPAHHHHPALPSLLVTLAKLSQVRPTGHFPSRLIDIAHLQGAVSCATICGA